MHSHLQRNKEVNTCNFIGGSFYALFNTYNLYGLTLLPGQPISIPTNSNLFAISIDDAQYLFGRYPDFNAFKMFLKNWL